MLCELRVAKLGVIEDLSLVFGPGMTAVSGETGAGKTLVVEALGLLLGGRADPGLVRAGATEAVVEGRFVVGASEEAGQEVVVSRVVPREGRSRAYIDGRMGTAGALAELAGGLVDLHGQHQHQSLLSVRAQRDALDAYAGAGPARARRDAALKRLKQVGEALAEAGGSSSERQREIELLQFQLAELDAAKLSSPDEDDRLAQEQEALSRASEHRAAAELAHEALAGDEQLGDRLGRVVAELAGHPPLAGLRSRLAGLGAELADAAEEARLLAESLEDDPERLAEVTARRALLFELRRKYARQPVMKPVPSDGAQGSLAGVFEWRETAQARLKELESLAVAAERLAGEHAAALAELLAAARELGRVRREAAARLGSAVEAELRKLAMPRARFAVAVGDNAPEGEGEIVGDEGEVAGDVRELSGEDVSFLLSANAGEPLLPLAKVASGGELARAMLALRLVLLKAGHERATKGSEGGPREPLFGSSGQAGPQSEAAGPETLVFDEVDAGIGGEAALAVGQALAELGQKYQVIVVTHLAQVAAFATHQVAVTKLERGGLTITTAAPVSGEQRVVELSRMLSGQPASKTARLHAEELLQMGARSSRRRARGGPARPTRRAESA